MKKIFLLFVIFVALNSQVNAQVTHALGFQLGVTNVYYKSTIPGSKSFVSIFMPTYSFDYAKYSDNLFWAGLGIGITTRNVAFYQFANYTKIGIEAGEPWIRVRTGLKFEKDFITHLPFIGLGVGKLIGARDYLKNGGTTSSISTFSLKNVSKYSPFIELGSTLINTTFRENKRNVFFTFMIRYYPTPLFKDKIDVEYEPFEHINVQYQLIEFVITAGIQHHFQK